MSQAPPPTTISSASPITQICPLCHKRPVMAKKEIYGHPVCKKCFYAFANRRQLGYLIDAVLFLAVSIPWSAAARFIFLRAGIRQTLAFSMTIMPLVGIPIACLFLMKDGFRGRSPGRMATDTVVLDEPTQQPIGFGQSFKRNLVLLVGQIPLAGSVVSLVIIIIIALQVAKGYRLGDHFARTKVIWKRYAHLPVFGGTATVCEQCGYDLNGNTSGVCPECGAPVSEFNHAKLLRGSAILAT